ncbi:protein turtle isoform X3 [Planococcus citri]|uniref:protein turtle isoform X3 n=1 Tax=Planococcus citri TaxID=170843 RepID=UPI0031F77F2C
MGLRLDLDHASSLTIASFIIPFICSTYTSFFVAFVLAISSKIAYSSYQDAMHITAILGESVVFNCPVEFPGDHPVPYVLQWGKKGKNIPIFIWYENYPTHSGEGYEGRVSRVTADSPYGLASLNLTNIKESDQGWYECSVVFLNRPPSTQNKNGTWFHLDVHAPPRFVVTPEEIIYVNLGDAIILNCQADGTPAPEIVWFKDEHPVDPSTTTGIFNDGTELRISSIRHEDIGDYTCIARNGEGQISHTARVIIAGAAVIMTPPMNQTKLEGEKLEFPCGAKALPGNVTIQWSKDGQPVREVSSLETRLNIKKDGTLVINPVSGDDSGQYKCEVSNGIGEAQVASAYLNVEYPAKVTFTPTVQYLPFRLGGVVQCYIKANPPLQYVTWTKDKRLLEPYQTKDIIVMNNGSLLFTRVNQNHQGRYTCTPYNAQGTQGSSGHMEVLVRKPPTFTVEPESHYLRKVGETVDMFCDAQEAEGTQKPKIEWQRKDGQPLPKNRVRISGGNITIDGLRRTDFGNYLCIASNEVATIMVSTQLVVEGTQPHAPYNISANTTAFTATVYWLPGYSGGPDYKQDYTIWYREAGVSDWSRIPVIPQGNTFTTITNLKPSTMYEFQVVGKNALGDGMLSKIITARTLDDDTSSLRSAEKPKNPVSSFTSPPADGPRPGAPRNVTVQEVDSGFVISWEAPQERPEMVKYYTIMYRIDDVWKDLTRSSKIRSDETKYLVKNMVGGRTYFLRVIAHSNSTHESSEEVKFIVPARVKQKAVTAGVVGGILFFIVAIILSICAVKICNKRKRRRQEKAYNMVACRITDARNGGQIPTVRQVPLNKSDRAGISRMNNVFNMMLKCVAHPHRTCIYSRDGIDAGKSSADYDNELHARRVRPISRAPDGRFILSSSSRSSSISSSIDDGGFLTHPAFRDVAPFGHHHQPRPGGGSGGGGSAVVLVHQHQDHHSSRRSEISMDSRNVAQGQTPHHAAVSAIYTPFLSSSPASTIISPLMSPAYFSDLSSVRQPSSAERTLRSGHDTFGHELPSLQAIREENERILNSYSPSRVLKPRISRPSAAARHIKYARSAPELAVSVVPETSPESRSSSSGLGSKNTSHQTGSTGTAEWSRLPPYRHPPAPPPPPPLPSTSGMLSAKPPYLRTWLDYTPSPTQSVTSNKPLSVDDHYEFDPIFPASPTPTELVLTPLPPAVRVKPAIASSSHHSKQDEIEARVQAMKEEFHEYKRRQAQMKRLKEFESIC